VIADRTATVEESALARRYRYAQANRLIRAMLARDDDARGADTNDTIKGPNGWIQPEDVDFAAADRHFDRADSSE
jgi:hypothetical protein